MKYIDSEKLIAEINNRIMSVNLEELGNFGCHRVWAYNDVKDLITYLQQEQPGADLEKLGKIARHLIAVKDHEEDMRLDECEWLLLERIGYPERFNARKK